MASSSLQYKTREDAKRARELDEARKAGLAPAEVDAETGQAINPHIPQYMTNAPWYLSQEKPSLKHLKDWRLKEEEKDKWYARGAKGKANVKFKKGACENCGAMTHKTKDCLERPRKKLAKHSKADLAHDDVITDVEFKSWDHKRDAYKGYTADDYQEVVDRYEKLNEARQSLLRHEAAQEKYADGAPEAAPEATATDVPDEDKLGEEEQAEFTKVEKAVRTTGGGATGSVRNLRIREDTAKYLLNLDPKSAHYDPKSRSMRADPNPDKPASEKTFAGDNALRETGDEYAAWSHLTQHTVMEAEKGSAAHVQAAPTQAVMAHANFKAKKAQLAAKAQAAVLAKYGNAAAAAPAELDLGAGESEAYVEYDRTGRVIKGVETVARSRYDEDVHPQNHTSVWGSYWERGQWGYTCCKSFVKNSMCLGAKAELVAAQNAAAMAANAERVAAERAAAASDAQQSGEAARSKAPAPSSAALWGTEGEAGAELDEGKVQAALRKLQQADGIAPEDADADGKAYNGLGADGTTVTAEEMEAYRRYRARAADPMAQMQQGGTAGGYDLV